MCAAAAGGTPCASRPDASACGSEPESPRIMSVKKIPIESTWAEFWNVLFMPPPAPRCCAGRLFITAARFGAANAPIESPMSSRIAGEERVGEVDRQLLEQHEGERRDEHAPGREEARPVTVGEEPRERPCEQEADRQGHHEDPGPERRRREVVAVPRKPDPLQPDDQHEHQPTAGDRREEARGDAEGEGPDPEECEPEHRIVDALLDDDEGDQERHAGRQRPDHERARPAGRLPRVGRMP